MKIKGIKKAIGDYKRANAGGCYSPRYGHLMLDMADGEMWTDEFYSLGHNAWKVYDSASIINLGRRIAEDGETVCMATARKYAEELIAEYCRQEAEV